MPDHATDGGDLGHIGQSDQLVLEEPVLQAAQLRQVVVTTAVDQCVLVDPADAGGIRTERRLGTTRQPTLHLTQILQHPRTRPVQVGAVLEQHVDIAVAEERVTANGFRTRHREHGGGQRIGHLILDNLRRLPWIRRADDHLHVGQVRQGIDRRGTQRPDAHCSHQQRHQQHQGTIEYRPANQCGNHGCGS